MSTPCILWTALAAAALATAGCQSTLTPDARQANPPTANVTVAAAPAATTPPATPPGRGMGGGEGEGRPTTGGPAPVRGRGGPAVPVGLENTMSEMNRMLTALKTDAPDPTKAEQALRDLATFERDVASCKLLVPPQINRMTGDAKTEALTSYRSMMTGLTKTLLDLEDAVNDKKPDDAKKLIAQLQEIEKQGHTELKVGND